MNHVRDLLLYIEAAESGSPRQFFAGRGSPLEGVPESDINEYLRILTNAGFVRVDGFWQEGSSQYWDRVNLEWLGHELLNDIKGESVWVRTQEAVQKYVGFVSVTVLAEVARSKARELLGIAPGA